MKKRILPLVLAALLALTLCALPAAAADVGVRVNGSDVRWTDAAPFIDVNSRTMVPLRAVAEALGLTAAWDDPKHEASFSDGRSTIIFPVGSRAARTDAGGIVLMDTEAVIVNDRTYAPIRYLAEFFGYAVNWDDSIKTVLITGGANPASHSDLPAPAEGLKMWVAGAACAPGGTVTVYWTGATAEMLSAGAWIGLARQGMTSDEYLDYRYLDGDAGMATFTAPDSPCVCEVRFYRAGYTGDESLVKDMSLPIDVA